MYQQEMQKNIARKLKVAMEQRRKTVTEFSEELGIPMNSLKNYLRGRSNPRADTIALLAECLELTPAELISNLPDSTVQAELVTKAAKEVGELAPVQREEGVRLFLALVELFSQQDKADHQEPKDE